MRIKVKINTSKLEKLGSKLADIERATKNVVDELKSIGLPAIFLADAAKGKKALRYSKNSFVAKSIYRSTEFTALLNSFQASQCIKSKIRFDKTKTLHASFLDAKISGDVEVTTKEIIFSGQLYDYYDFRKSKDAKVKSAFGKLLRDMGNTAKELQDAGYLQPYSIRVDLEIKLKRKWK